MTDKQKSVLKVILELSDEERREVIREAQSFETKSFSEKRSLNESFGRVLGPTSSLTCPYCGK